MDHRATISRNEREIFTPVVEGDEDEQEGMNKQGMEPRTNGRKYTNLLGSVVTETRYLANNKAPNVRRSYFFLFFSYIIPVFRVTVSLS